MGGVRGWGGEAAGGMRGGGAAGGQSLMGKLFCWGGGRGGSCLSGRGRGGWGEGGEGLIFTSYFYTRGEFSLCWVGGGGCPSS